MLLWFRTRTSMFRGYYDKARKQFEREGLLDPMKLRDDSVASISTVLQRLIYQDLRKILKG